MARLIVAHGLGRHPDEWLACARAIDPFALVPDLPELRSTDLRPDHMAVAERIVDALDEEGLMSAVWLGHSGGAHAMIDAAIEFPSRVEKLVLVSAAPTHRAGLLHCPVLVIAGERDPIRGSNQIIAGAGHDPHISTPAALVEIVRSWID